MTKKELIKLSLEDADIHPSAEEMEGFVAAIEKNLAKLFEKGASLSCKADQQDVVDWYNSETENTFKG